MDQPLHPGGFAQLTKQQTVDAFAKDLHDACKSCLPTYEKPYKKVNVLLLRWISANDTLVEHSDCLKKIFEQYYNYDCETYEIGIIKDKCETALVMYLAKIAVSLEEGDLFIVHYIGHGYTIDETSHRVPTTYWTPDKVKIAPRFQPLINFQNIAVGPMGVGEFDVLWIVDCCHAGGAVYHIGRKEILAAVGLDQVAADSQCTFTRFIREQLEVNYAQPMSTAQLYGKLLQEVRADKEDKMSALMPTPIHAVMNPEIKSSIILTPLRTNPLKTATDTKPFASEEVFVLIKVKLTGKPSVEEFRRYLTQNIPSNIVDIVVSVESVHKSKSSTWTVKIPIAVWSMLRNDPAYSFLDFIHSRNMLLGAGFLESHMSQLAVQESIAEHSRRRAGSLTENTRPAAMMMRRFRGISQESFAK